MNDKTIIKLMQSRPDKGIYEAIRKYENLLTTVAGRLLSDRQDIEECVSDTFVDVWKHMSGLDPEKGSLKGYLICTVRNNAINRFRKNRRDRTTPQSHILELVEHRRDLEEEILGQADVQTMLELIGEMEEPDREILIRKHLMFEPTADIAIRLNMTSNQVKYRLQRAKAHLRSALIRKGIAI